MGDCSFDPSLCSKEGLSQHGLQIGWILLVLACFIITACLWVWQLLALRALHLSLPRLLSGATQHDQPFTAGYSSSQWNLSKLNIWCVFSMFSFRPCALPSSQQSVVSVALNLQTFRRPFKSPRPLHSAELTTCEQTEEAAGLGENPTFSVRKCSHLQCDGFSCINNNHKSKSITRLVGWGTVVTEWAFLVAFEPVLEFPSRAEHFCRAATDQAQLTLSPLLSAQMLSELQNAATLT